MHCNTKIRAALLFRSMVCAVAFAASSTSVVAADKLTIAEFKALHEELQVGKDKPWRTIPWKTTMLDAQRSASEEAKPIFIWAMDGHPLGCT